MVESVLRAGTGLSAIVLQLGTLETRALEVSTILHLSVHIFVPSIQEQRLFIIQIFTM